MHNKTANDDSRIYFFASVIGVIFLIIYTMLFYLHYIKAAAFIIFFIIFGALSMIYQLYTRLSLGIDLVFIGTILCSIAYGPVAGVIVGTFGMLLGKIISAKLNTHILITLVAIGMVGMTSYYIYSGDVFTTGIIMVMLYNIILLPIIFLMGGNPIKMFMFTSTHIIFNWWMFKHVAPLLIWMMM